MKWLPLLFHFLQVQDFIFSTCRRYNIDYSHNMHHSFQVLELADTIAKRDYSLTTNEKTVLDLSCLLHDMCDNKYTIVYQSSLDISKFLLTDLCVPHHIHDGVMNTIMTMSFNKIVQTDNRVVYPMWLETEWHYRDAFHIAREADLLTSYDLKRMVHYKHERLGLQDFDTIHHDIRDTVENRMRLLIDPLHLFVSPTAKKIAKAWEAELMDTLEHLDHKEVEKIWHDIPLTLPQFRDKIKTTLR